MAVSGVTSRWLPFGDGRDARVRLLCLPHAGAGASAYRMWGGGLPREIAACPIQPPGRESRLGEEPYQHVQPLVADLAYELGEITERPYAVFGHSVGALVAFELIREIRRLGGAAPIHLFVAGRPAPQLADGKPPLRDLTIEQLATMLQILGGTPERLLADRELLAAIVPVFRADFSVNETYRYAAQPPLDLPITVFGATADPRADERELRAWQHQTSHEFRLHMLSGGHFAVFEQAPFVHVSITEALTPSL